MSNKIKLASQQKTEKKCWNWTRLDHLGHKGQQPFFHLYYFTLPSIFLSFVSFYILLLSRKEEKSCRAYLCFLPWLSRIESYIVRYTCKWLNKNATLTRPNVFDESVLHCRECLLHIVRRWKRINRPNKKAFSLHCIAFLFYIYVTSIFAKCIYKIGRLRLKKKENSLCLDLEKQTFWSDLKKWEAI